MEIYVTRHARNRMRLYEIEIKEIEDALDKLERVTVGAFERRHAWKQRPQGDWLRITFKEEGTRRIVITVTPKSGLPGETHDH